MFLLRCYVAMYARLQAEEALLATAVGLAGNPMTDADDRKRIVGPWEKTRAAEQPRRKPERLTPEQFAMRMKLIGMEAGDGASH